MREKILNILNNATGYVSGEEMSRDLGISRAAVWKHIKKLKSEGYKIESVTNKGYRLAEAPKEISPSTVDSLLNTGFIARSIQYTDSTASTNEDAKRLASSVDGTLFIADRQTAGKGRLGRGWESPRGSGIWMSLLLKPEISPNEISGITLIAGIAVCRAIGGSAKIKWPNDIVMGGRKVSGILTEMSAEVERVSYVVCGIGINVNTAAFPPELSEKATSLYVETGRSFDRNKLIAAVMNEFEPLYKGFIKNGFEPFRAEYRDLCASIKREVRIISRGSEMIGTAIDIDKNGGLVVMTAAGTVTVTSGEVSVRGIYGYI